MRLLALLCLALLGCDNAVAQEVPHTPVTAGPQRDIALAPGDQVLVTLERATDPAAVDQTVGLILPVGGPVMLSARVTIDQGRAVVEVVTGHRGDAIGEYVSHAWVPDGIITPVIIWPGPGEVAALRVTSTEGAVVRAGDDARQTWLTAVPIALPQ